MGVISRVVVVDRAGAFRHHFDESIPGGGIAATLRVSSYPVRRWLDGDTYGGYNRGDGLNESSRRVTVTGWSQPRMIRPSQRVDAGSHGGTCACLRAVAALALVIAMCPSLCLATPVSGHHATAMPASDHGDHGAQHGGASVATSPVMATAPAGCVEPICDAEVLKGLPPAIRVVAVSTAAPVRTPSTLSLAAVPVSTSGWPKFPSGVSPPRAL